MSEYVVDLTDVKKQKFSWSMEMLYDSVPVREEIVRCRDCVAYEPYLTYAGTKLDFGECMRAQTAS